MIRTRLALLPIAVLLCGFSSDRFEDPATGLTAVPPSGYTLIDLASYGEQTTAAAVVGIYPERTTDLADPPTPFCILTLHARDDFAGKTQDELNTAMRDPATIDPMKAQFDTIEDAPLAMQGKNGHWFVMAGPRGPISSQDRAQVVSIFDTPSGRVTLSCQAMEESLEQDRATIDSIREAVTLP